MLSCSVNGKQLDQVFKIWDLGVIFDSELKSDDQRSLQNAVMTHHLSVPHALFIKQWFLLKFSQINCVSC
jgi:hypothetical protein